MPRRPQRDSKRRKGPSGPEQLARKQAREAGDQRPSEPAAPVEPVAEEAVDQTPAAVEPTTADAAVEPAEVAAPAPAPAPAFRAPARGTRAMPQPSAFRASRQSRQQVDRLSIPTVVQAQLKSDLVHIGAISVLIAGILGALTVVLG